MCGAVGYRAELTEPELGACHCSMCRRWSGGVFLGIAVQPVAITFSGEDHIQHFQSSDWAERAFCRKCGSNLYYRVTAPSEHQGIYHLAAGSIDDMKGMLLSQQMFIDQKPSGYSFCETTADLTQAQFEALFLGAET